MVWFDIGNGTACYKYKSYHEVEAKDKTECVQKCQEDSKCALVAYRKKRQKCILCTEGYELKKTCPYPVELVAKGMNLKKLLSKSISFLYKNTIMQYLVLSCSKPCSMNTTLKMPGLLA